LAVDKKQEAAAEEEDGNLKLKRLLSKDSNADSDNPSAKRQKVGGIVTPPPPPKKMDPMKRQLLARWGLSMDPASCYVIEAAEMEDVEAVARMNWQPNKFHERKTCAEQLCDHLNRSRDMKGPPGGNVDALQAFKHAKDLKDNDVKSMKDLVHKELQYVMQEYDGTRPIDEIVEEACKDAPDEIVDAAPGRPGIYTMGRKTRLELIDPSADALVCGDANLTFSLLLAQHRKALGHAGRTVATTFETLEILRERYTEIDATIKELHDLEAEVMHNVDGTRLAVDPRFLGMEARFGAVYYNFPHAGVVKGFFDGHPFVRWRHENLMSLFFRALRGFVKEGGLVKVSSNSNATGVRYGDIMQAASMSEFVHVETIPFLEWQLRGYRRSYGDRRDAERRPEDGENYKSQRAHADMVYCYRYAPSGGDPPKLRIRHPPTKTDLLLAEEGHIKTLPEHAKKRRVEDIYKLFLSYVQGIHVG